MTPSNGKVGMFDTTTAARPACWRYRILLVGVRGFEPPAPASRTQCSTRLSYTPAKARAYSFPGRLPQGSYSRSAGTAGARGKAAQPLQQWRHAVGHLEQVARSGRREPEADRGFDRGQQRRGRTGDVAQQDRLVVQPKLSPGDDLDGLVQRAQPARQRHERVRLREHALLAAVHAVGHVTARRRRYAPPPAGPGTRG